MRKKKERKISLPTGTTIKDVFNSFQVSKLQNGEGDLVTLKENYVTYNQLDFEIKFVENGLNDFSAEIVYSEEVSQPVSTLTANIKALTEMLG
jgi:hypothetical protein